MSCFFYNDPAPTEMYTYCHTLSLHDARPICTTSIADICYLQDLFTAEAARGRGIASALILRVAEEARAAGAVRVYWQTHETNNTARRLYDAIAERSGFLVYRITLCPALRLPRPALCSRDTSRMPEIGRA